MIEQPAEPLLVVISGPSGVGKDTVLDHMKQRGLPFHFVVTATTRPRRPGETEGVDYFFVEEQVFLDMINKGGNNAANFGGRILYDLVENEMSDFYTGIGVAYDLDDGANVLRINVPLGFEFSFSGLPEIGLSLEAGFIYDYAKDFLPDAQSRISSVGGAVGGNFGLDIAWDL